MSSADLHAVSSAVFKQQTTKRFMFGLVDGMAVEPLKMRVTLSIRGVFASASMIDREYFSRRGASFGGPGQEEGH